MRNIWDVMEEQQRWIDKAVGLSGILNPLQDIYDYQKEWGKDFIGLAEIRKVWEDQKLFAGQFDLTKDILKDFDYIKQFALPKNTLTELIAVQDNYTKAFNQWNELTKPFFNHTDWNELANLQKIFSEVTTHITTENILAKNWDAISNFEGISDEAFTIGTRVIESESLGKQDLQELKDLIYGLKQEIANKDKDAMSVLLKWLTIISFILAVLSEGRHWINQPESVTKVDLENFKRELFQELRDSSVLKSDHRNATRDCYVYNKGKKNSGVVGEIATDSGVIVLGSNHRWLFISYENISDTFGHTGWVKKKCFQREK